MALAVATLDKDTSRRRKILTVSATPSGNYVPGGDTLDFTLMTNPKMISNGKVSALPKFACVLNSPGGYNAEIILGTTLKNSKLKVYTLAGTEMGAVAYPAALLADPFQLELTGPLGNF